MRTSYHLVIAGVVLAGCFEGGADSSRTAAAQTMAQGILAFPDIEANLTTDPATAATALLAFVKTPVAADNLVSPPFDFSVMDSARVSPDSPVPGCLTTMGMPSCDGFTTNDTCTAGGFSFQGNATRTCNPCNDPASTCAYNWTLPALNYTSSAFTLDLKTAGSATLAASQVTANMTFSYSLNDSTNAVAGIVSICSCGAATIQAGPAPTGLPRKLVNSSFVVKALPVAAPPRCALVNFDANENVTTTASCACADGSTCSTTALP